MNYCINAAWHEGNQPVACSGVMEAQVDLIADFRSSALLGLMSLINTPDSLWGSGQVSLLANQAQLHHVH